MKRTCFPSLLALALAASAPAQEPASAGDWTFALGVMGNQGPSYLGSEERETRVVPILMLDYKSIVGIQWSKAAKGAAGVFFRPLRTESWSLGFLAMPELSGRDEDSAKALKGMGDRSANLFVGLDMTYRTEPFSAGLEILKGTRGDSGMLASLSLGHSRQLTQQLGLEVGLTGVWGNQDYQAWEFGITPVQAARRQALINAGNGYLRSADARPYAPKAGLREIRAEAGLHWQVSERWMTFASVEHGRLLGDAAKSPLTRSKKQTGAAIGFGYQFAGGHGAD